MDHDADIADIAAARLGSTCADGEDLCDESLLQVQKDVAELAEKVMRYRETGPAAFASLLEKSLSQSQTRLSQQISTAADITTSEDKPEMEGGAERVPGADEVNSQLADLRNRFAASRASFPNIIRDLKACKERLDRAINVNLSFQPED